jgi:hypothetical protein
LLFTVDFSRISSTNEGQLSRLQSEIENRQRSKLEAIERARRTFSHLSNIMRELIKVWHLLVIFYGHAGGSLVRGDLIGTVRTAFVSTRQVLASSIRRISIPYLDLKKSRNIAK